MTEAPKHLVRTRDLSPDDAVHVRHPLNPNSEVYVHRLGDMVGMKRAHLSLARVPPGRESFIPHAHSLQEEFLYILEGSGVAEIGPQRVPVGPGDYLGFPTDGTPHHLHNVGDGDLVYLMGGERTEVEVAYFPTVHRIAIAHGPDTSFFEEAAAEHIDFAAWIVDQDEPAQR